MTAARQDLTKRERTIYDPLVHSSVDDPYSIYKQLRDRYPVYRNEERGVWALSRFADVQAAARDWQTFSSEDGVDLDDTGDVLGAGNILDMDPPRHDELRDIVRKSFSPKSVGALEETIRRRAHQLVDSLGGRHVVDLSREYAWRLPVTAMARVLGFPAADEDLLRSWAEVMTTRCRGDSRVPQDGIAAAGAFVAYLDNVIADHRANPGDGVIADVVTAERDGRIQPSEICGLCFILYIAAIETSASLISNSLWLLARHPEQRAAIAADPSTLPAAIEEILRYESPVQYLARTTRRVVELHGTVIPEGSRVVLVFGSANRDPRRFDDPDRLDLHRHGKRHLAFGEGIHHCVGAPVARLDARVALEVFLSRSPNYVLAGPAERVHAHTTRGLSRLPVALGDGGI